MDTQLTTTPAATLVTRNPFVAYTLTLAPSSQRTMTTALQTVARLFDPEADAVTFPWHQIEYSHVLAVRARLLEAYAPRTVNRLLSALRGVLKQAWLLDLMDPNVYHRCAAVKGSIGKTLPAGRSLSAGEIRALFDACPHTHAGDRDAAILAVAYGCGLRRAELVGLNLADYDPEAGSLRVLGKGRKERLAYTPAGVAAALDGWLTVRGDEPGPLFYRVRKGDTIEPLGLTPQAIFNLFKKLAKRAGIRDFSPHDLRRSFAGDMLDAGADLSVVSKLMGHALITTTAQYDRRPEAAKKNAAALLHVPVRR